MSDYKEANRQKLRFETNRGALTIEQLWDISINELDQLAVKLQEEYESSGKKSFLVKRTTKDKTAKLKFDIVLDVLNTKSDEMETLREAREVKEHNEKILHLIAEKQDESLKDKSIKQLESMLK